MKKMSLRILLVPGCMLINVVGAQAMDGAAQSLCPKLTCFLASAAYKKAAMAVTKSFKPMAAHYVSAPTPEGMEWVPYGVDSNQGRLHDRLYDYTIMAARGVSSFAHITQELVKKYDLHEKKSGAKLAPTTAPVLCEELERFYEEEILPAFHAVGIPADVDVPTEEELRFYHSRVISCIKIFGHLMNMDALKKADEAISYIDAMSLEVAPREAAFADT